MLTKQPSTYPTGTPRANNLQPSTYQPSTFNLQPSTFNLPTN
ncbi:MULTISPECIES: hypothetical protein [Moorena]|nr:MULTISPECIES: hypothetical protein [Moorena]